MDEKHGALWIPEAQPTGTLVVEQYFQRADMLGVVWLRPDGLYRATCFTKGNDPQWRLPCWSEAGAGALLGSLKEAEAHMVRLVQSNA